MVSPLHNIYQGCARLTAVNEERTMWANKDTVVRYNADSKRVEISQHGHEWSIPVDGKQAIDLYLPTEGVAGYQLASTAQHFIPKQLHAQCGFVPGATLAKLVPGTTHEKSRLIHYIKQHFDEVKAGRFEAYVHKHWDTHAHYVRQHAFDKLPAEIWAQFTAEFQARPRSTGVARGEVLVNNTQYQASEIETSTSTAAARATLAEFVRRYRSNPHTKDMVILCDHYDTKEAIQAALPKGINARIVVAKQLGTQHALIAIPSTKVSLDDAVQELQRHAGNLQEALRAANGVRPAHSMRSSNYLSRVLYRDCQDLAYQRQPTGQPEWVHPEAKLRVWPGRTADTALIAAPGRAAILDMPNRAFMDLYVPEDFTTPNSIDLLVRRETHKHTELQQRVSRAHQCALPLTAAETEARRLHQRFPKYEFGLSFKVGDGVQFYTGPALSSLQRLETDTAELALGINDIDPENMSAVIPDVQLPSDIALISGVAMDFQANLVRNKMLQIFGGLELAYTDDRTNVVNDGQRNNHEHLIDIWPQVGFRHAYLAFDEHMPLSTVRFGLGLGMSYDSQDSVSTSPMVGYSQFIEASLWRFTLPQWNIDLFARWEMRFLSRNAGYRAEDFTETLQFPEQVEGLEESIAQVQTILFGVRIAIPFGAPPPAPEPPRDFIIRDGASLITPPLNMNLASLSEEAAQQILASNDLETIFAHPVFANAAQSGLAGRVPKAKDMHDYFRSVIDGVTRTSPDTHYQIVVMADVRDASAAVRKQRHAQAQRGAQVVKHIMSIMGVNPLRLFVASWNTLDAERTMQHPTRSYADEHLRKNTNVFFRELRPTRY